jgi:hypothetical protein
VAIDHALPQSAVLTGNDGDTDGASNSTADSAGDADPDGAAADREPELDLVE